VIRIRLLPALVLACAACSSGTETGNPPASRVTFALMTTDASVASTTPGTGHLIQELRLSLQSVTLLDCNGHDVASTASAGIVDVVAGSNSVSVTSGNYCGVRVNLAGTNAAPVITVQGTRSDGVPFTIDDPNSVAITLTSTTPFTLHPDEPLLVAFDLGIWFGGTFLQDASTAGGHVTIDASSNLAALSPFESQVAAGLYRDPNDNGHVEHSDGPSIAAGHSLHTQ